MSKVSGGDIIPAELFQILKGDAVKVLHSMCQQIWKTQQWPQDWKRSIFIPVPKKAVPKNVQTTTQLCSFRMLTRQCSKSFKLGFTVYELRTSRCTNATQHRQRSQKSIANICWITEKAREIQISILFYFIDCVKAFDYVDQHCGKFLKRWEYQTTFPSLLRNLYAGQKATVRNTNNLR